MRLSDVHGGSETAVIAVFGELQSFFVRVDGGIEKLFLSVEAAQLEIIGSELGMKAQIDVGEIGGGGLRFGAAGFDGAAHAAPEVGFVGNVNGDSEVVVVLAFGRRIERAAGFARGACGDADGLSRTVGKQIRAGDAESGARLGELFLRGFQGLVGDVNLLFERIELRILINLPPLAFGDGVAGLRRFPIGRQFFVSRGDFRGRADVIRADGATGEEQARPRQTIAANERRLRSCAAHGLMSCRRSTARTSLWIWAAAIFTCSPSMIESGGLTMMDSWPVRPETTSISEPKSRPGVMETSLALLSSRRWRPANLRRGKSAH